MCMFLNQGRHLGTKMTSVTNCESSELSSLFLGDRISCFSARFAAAGVVKGDLGHLILLAFISLVL